MEAIRTSTSPSIYQNFQRPQSHHGGLWPQLILVSPVPTLPPFSRCPSCSSRTGEVSTQVLEGSSRQDACFTPSGICSSATSRKGLGMADPVERAPQPGPQGHTAFSKGATP